MDSPSSSSIANYYYKEFLADEGESTDEEVEQEAIMSACQLAVRYMKHCSRPEREIKTRDYIERDRRAANDRLMKDYFDEAPTYPNPEVFRRRFRMSKRLFLRIVEDFENNFDYFKQKADVKGTLEFTGIQKCTSSLRVFAYGNTTDINDEYLKMAEKTTRDTLEIFVAAVASQDLWVWSAYFGVVESCNDINVFEQSPLLEDYISGRAPKASFYANGNYYPHGYYLCDGIYPRYSIVVKTFSDPFDEKRAHFKKFQESARKDIERFFGVLKQRWQ
ncbi:uncharacterized protein LOC110883386 [Helianthus annuus]|uniref:uncharacterized protein LOC110883386 n=1 Tax=Helianthus annuus TaxID=4232 RepID=UPI000B906046|nr:uncharacterized protein LOC110883386 [Helianthus annuus]